MKLIVLVEDFYPNTSGGAHVRWRFSQMAVEHGHDIVVYTPKREGTPSKETVDGVEIRRPFSAQPASLPAYLPVAFLFRMVFTIRLLVHLLTTTSFEDVDGIHSASNMLHWVGKIISKYHKIQFICFVGYTPSLNPDVDLSPKLILERLTFKYCLGETTFCRSKKTQDLIVSYSDTNVQVIHGILNESKLREAIEGLEPGSLREDLAGSSDGRLFAFVGRLTPVKNPSGAIEILTQLPREDHLLIVGSGDERDHLQEQIEDAGLEHRVDFLGEVSHQTALRTMAVVDGLLVTSRAESYSAVALEALTVKTHVFATPVGVLPELKNDRLHLGPISEISNYINNADIEPGVGLDTKMLHQFSMSRYTHTILESFMKSE